MTKPVFDVFRGFRVHRVHHASLSRTPVIETLNRFGLAWFEAKTSYLSKR
jgi:hypothetical protein